nr:immunoglobulin heavy chain junction region [Mus musculus]
SVQEGGPTGTSMS